MGKGNKSNRSVEDLEKQTLTSIVALQMILVDANRAIDELQRKMQKYDDIYYRIFPERLEKDAQFEEQLRTLKSPGTGATKKRS